MNYYEEVFIPKAKEYLQTQKLRKLEEKISRITGNLGKALGEKDFKKAKEINNQISEFLDKKIEQENKEELETSQVSQEKPKTRPESPKGSRIKTSRKTSLEEESCDCITM